MGAFAPEFARLNDDVLFGEEWSRNDILSLRDRSLVTVVSLLAQGLADFSFKYHLIEAKKNGISQQEIAEILTHAAFYVGWPKAWAAFRLAKEVWTNENESTANTGCEVFESKEAIEQNMLFPIGNANEAYAKYFIGTSYLSYVSNEQVTMYNVTFEPRCRNNWHVHHAIKGGGQILICMAGRGWFQEWGKPARQLLPGDVVNIPAGVKHWHGAAANTWFAHLAVEVDGENCSNEWLEPVTDEVYDALK